MGTIGRAEWLRLEISLYEDELGHTPADSPRRQRIEHDLQAYRAELETIEDDGGRLNVRLTGGAIHGNNAPADVVLAITRAMGELAHEFGTNLYLAPATKGSHVLNFVAPPQPQGRLDLDEDAPPMQTFADSAGVLMGLSNQGAPPEEASQMLDETIASLSKDALSTAKRLFAALADRDVTLHLDALSRDLSGHRRVDREWASYVKLLLDGTSKTVEHFTFQGRLEGLLRSALRFELETSERMIRGRVPSAMRDDVVGVRIGEEVVAEVDQVTTVLASGGTRSFWRLTGIRPASKPTQSEALDMGTTPPA